MARKEAVSANAAPPTASAATSASAKDAQTQQAPSASDGIDNYDLPKALVTRIAKSSIPESSKLQKDTVTALVKGSTVFINFLAATAHDIASSRQHKSVSASDVLKALETIQFGDMVDPLQHELNVYRENIKSGKKRTTTTTGTNGNNVSASKNNLSGIKSKGKERAPSALSNSVSAADIDANNASGGISGEGMEVDVAANEAEEEEDELDDEPQEDVDEADENEEEEEEEAEEIIDQMAVDDEQERDDIRASALKGGATEYKGK